MIDHEPATFFYFSPVMSVLFIGLMNMITATIVQKYMYMQKTDSEAELAYLQQERKKLLPKLYQLFELIDADKDGNIDIEEIFNAPPEVHLTLMQIMKVDDVAKIFIAIDIDDSGTVTVDEFIEGLLWMVEGGTKEQLKLEKLMTSMHRKQDRLDMDREMMYGLIQEMVDKTNAAFGDGHRENEAGHAASSKEMFEDVRRAVRSSQQDIQANRDSLRALAEKQDTLSATVAVLASNVQQLVAGQQALAAQLTSVGGNLGGKSQVDRLAFCSNCKEVTRTSPTKTPISSVYS
jgi:hypothetical protein